MAQKRQQKRRLIQPDFVALLASRVVYGGRLHLATDWADYSAHMLEVLDTSQWIGATSPAAATRCRGRQRVAKPISRDAVCVWVTESGT